MVDVIRDAELMVDDVGYARAPDRGGESRGLGAAQEQAF